MRVAGNRGEWSELYALVELLHSGKLYAADENANRISDIYFPILRIIRQKDADKSIDYVINQGRVDVVLDGKIVSSISKEYLNQTKLLIYNGILSGADRSFEISGAPEAMSDMLIDKIKASSSDKADIVMQIHDIHTGYEPVCGFSIKSELGNPPTLLNASGATNFVFEIKGITDDDMKRINSIDSRNKILDRISAITQKGEMKFVHSLNAIFSTNLMLIDSYMEDIIAVMLLDYYQDKAASCRELVKLVEKKNPLGYPRSGFYEYKFKKFLCSIALGMMPSKEWNGRDEANGGYVIVKENGDVLAYHIYNRDAFETYLLNNTKLERASTSRHGYANIYKDKDKYYINLNLQIRFI